MKKINRVYAGIFLASLVVSPFAIYGGYDAYSKDSQKSSDQKASSYSLTLSLEKVQGLAAIVTGSAWFTVGAFGLANLFVRKNKH